MEIGHSDRLTCGGISKTLGGDCAVPWHGTWYITDSYKSAQIAQNIPTSVAIGDANTYPGGRYPMECPRRQFIPVCAGRTYVDQLHLYRSFCAAAWSQHAQNHRIIPMFHGSQQRLVGADRHRRSPSSTYPLPLVRLRYPVRPTDTLSEPNAEYQDLCKFSRFPSYPIEGSERGSTLGLSSYNRRD
ncbi:hypothetical protein BD413DRAFT_264991 [Trametes elegans]|nr:hypothetical protein BD413DRAFT_264991 [Trametes elegans]